MSVPTDGELLGRAYAEVQQLRAELAASEAAVEVLMEERDYNVAEIDRLRAEVSAQSTARCAIKEESTMDYDEFDEPVNEIDRLRAELYLQEAVNEGNRRARDHYKATIARVRDELDAIDDGTMTGDGWVVWNRIINALDGAE
jgi:chromosome segregation ATPase